MSALQAIRCRECGITSFPVADRCPVCSVRSVEVVQLAATGTVVSLARSQDVAVGEVLVDDGPLVLARLEGEPSPQIGERVRHVAAVGAVRFGRNA